jgi:acyl-CoA synthetase (AMP-forming)/AMP-acid ligase II
MTDVASEPVTWSGLVERAYAAGGTALVSNDGSWSGPDLLARASGVAHWLAGLGIPAGCPVPALFGTTTAAAVAATLGGAALGTPLAPVNPRLTVPELVTTVGGLGATALLCEPAFADLAARVAEVTGLRLAVLDQVPTSAEALPTVECWPAFRGRGRAEAGPVTTSCGPTSRRCST